MMAGLDVKFSEAKALCWADPDLVQGELKRLSLSPALMVQVGKEVAWRSGWNLRV